MSMTGLAASPGTAVEPTCSSCSTRQPSVSRIRPARASYVLGQAGSGSFSSMPTPGAPPATTQGSAPGGGGASSNETISTRLGIRAARLDDPGGAGAGGDLLRAGQVGHVHHLAFPGEGAGALPRVLV